MGRNINIKRPLTEKECILIEALVEGSCKELEIVKKLPFYLVEDMNDGGMGSLRFVYTKQEKQVFGSVFVEAEFSDEDDIPVNVTINLNQFNDLYELDMWKVDYSPLKRYPKRGEIRFFYDP